MKNKYGVKLEIKTSDHDFIQRIARERGITMKKLFTVILHQWRKYVMEDWYEGEGLGTEVHEIIKTEDSRYVLRKNPRR